jgi:ribonuclease HI
MPSPGWVKLNCDGSYKKEDGSAGAGMILRDDVGKVIFSSCRQLIRCGDPLEAETKACEEGLCLALQWSNCPVSLELDCSVLVEAIKGRTQNRSPLAHLIEEIKDIVHGSRLISIVKVDRVQNRASHCLANYARAEAITNVWSGTGRMTLGFNITTFTRKKKV